MVIWSKGATPVPSHLVGEQVPGLQLLRLETLRHLVLYDGGDPGQDVVQHVGQLELPLEGGGGDGLALDQLAGDVGVGNPALRDLGGVGGQDHAVPAADHVVAGEEAGQESSHRPGTVHILLPRWRGGGGVEGGRVQGGGEGGGALLLLQPDGECLAATWRAWRRAYWGLHCTALH